MLVNTNILAINSHRNMKNTIALQEKSSARLSSGLKINSAADDAAGLAISEKMRAQIRGLDMASKNTQDAISLIQTAEGGMQEIDNMIQRMRELTVQAANGTNEYNNKNGGDRQKIQDELNMLADEIDSMSQRVEFNNKKIISGDYFNDKKAQQNKFNSIIEKSQSKINNINNKYIKQDEQNGNPIGTTTVDTIYELAEKNLEGKGSFIGTKLSFESFRNAMDGYQDALDLVKYELWNIGTAFSDLGVINQIATLDPEKATFQNDFLKAVKETANAVKSVGVFVTGSGKDLKDITFINNLTNVTSFANISTQLSILGGGTDQKIIDLATSLGQLVVPTNTYDKFLKYSLNIVTMPKKVDGTVYSSFATNEIFLNAYNLAKTNNTTAEKEYDLAKSNIDTIKIENKNIIDAKIKLKELDLGDQTRFKPGLYFQVGANTNQKLEISIGATNTKGLGLTNTNGKFDINVVTEDNNHISSLIKRIDDALTYITSERSKLGAAQNRLEHTQKSLDVSSENLTASESRIRDTDMAKEMMNLTKANVLSQAAQIILGQANQAPQGVLQLLR